MKKIQKFVGMAALSAAVLTSCVKNEETDGVKSLREAQAGLINANAENVLANVKQTLENVNTTYYSNLSLKFNYLKDSLNYEIYKANFAGNQELAQLEIANAKLALQEEAILYQKNILGYQAQLQAAQASLETAIMQASITKEEKLKSYIAEYQSVLNDIYDLQVTIANKQYEIDIDNTVNNSVFDNDDLYAILIANKQADLDLQKLDLENLNTLLTEVTALQSSYNSTVNDGTYTAINTAYEAAKTELLTKWGAYEDQDLVVIKAKKDLDAADVNLDNATATNLSAMQTAYDTALKAYNDAVALRSRLASEYNYLETYTESLSDLVDQIKEQGSIDDFEAGVLYFKEAIISINEDIDVTEANIAALTADIADLNAGKTKEASEVAALQAEVASLNTLLADYKTQAAELYKLIEIAAE